MLAASFCALEVDSRKCEFIMDKGREGCCTAVWGNIPKYVQNTSMLESSLSSSHAAKAQFLCIQ